MVSVRKFLPYALGELILVIAGILIALLIYDWNDARKELQASIRYHERILEDLNLVHTLLEDNQILSDSIYSSLLTSIEALDAGVLTPGQKPSLDYALDSYYKYNPMTLRLHAYDELKGSGRLHLLQDEQLRTQLAYYSTLLDAVAEVYRIFGESIIATGPQMDRYFRIQPDIALQQPPTYQFEQMAADKTFGNSLSRIALAWNNRRAFNTRLITDTKALDSLVRKALEVLKGKT